MNKNLAALLVVLMAFVGTALAVNPHDFGTSDTGQPGINNDVSCGDSDTCGTPGHSGADTNTGSPFAEGNAGDHYAGADGNPTGSIEQNPGYQNAHQHPNSEYDVACLEVSQNPSNEHNPGCTTC